LSINGTAIMGSNSGISSMQNLITAINNQSPTTGVKAELDGNSNLKLSTTTAKDPNGTLSISIGPGKAADGTYDTNSLGLEPLDYDVTARLQRKLAADPTQTDIRLSFGSFGVPPDVHTGDPSDLGKLGLRTGAFIEGGSPDDLLVFVTGPGTAKVATSFTGQPDVPRDSLRSQSLTVKFTAPDRFSIIDTKTGTELADRHYDNTPLEPMIEFQGLQIKFNHAPSVGDSYQVDGNQDGMGNNVNMLDMVELNRKPVVNGKTLANSYIDQINNVGNLAQQATITQQALTVVNDQAIASRDKISGVNLDDEAANLIRLQQAYQANAKALQISGQLFDAIVQIR
jgi:flagellar hook-associated protein FlgK